MYGQTKGGFCCIYVNKFAKQRTGLVARFSPKEIDDNILVGNEKHAGGSESLTCTILADCWKYEHSMILLLLS